MGIFITIIYMPPWPPASILTEKVQEIIESTKE
jgi:hypothetical protein